MAITCWVLERPEAIGVRGGIQLQSTFVPNFVMPRWAALNW
jgi:hypothetical protein